jgi:hypothetical protein
MKTQTRVRVRVAVPALALTMATLAGAGSASAAEVASGHPVSAVSYTSRAPARVQYSRVRVNGLRFRTRASTHGTVRGLLYRGDRVEVIGWSGQWMHVRLTARSRGGSRAGATGWVAKRYLYGPNCHGSYSTWPCTAWR